MAVAADVYKSKNILPSRMVEQAQPQTILANDGFPIENQKFCGGAQEIMAILHNNKPVAATNFNKGYIFTNFQTSLKSKTKKLNPYHTCKPYTYEDVFKSSKGKQLLRLKYGTKNNYLYFRKQNTTDAYILYSLWGENSDTIQDTYNLSYEEVHIIIGLLLGYKRKDILSWFLMELEELFQISFDNLDERAAIVSNPEIQEKRNEITAVFSDIWKSASNKLELIRKELKPPNSWKAKITLLPKPSLTRKRLRTSRINNRMKCNRRICRQPTENCHITDAPPRTIE